MNKPWNVGTEVHDMHYRFTGTESIEVKDVVAFRQNAPQSFSAWLVAICRTADRFYTNKMLVIIDDEKEDGWFPAAWSYDGFSGGVCLVRQKPPTLAALIAEFQAWIKAEALERYELGSADEHLTDERLSVLQRRWLEQFCRRWDHAQEASK